MQLTRKHALLPLVFAFVRLPMVALAAAATLAIFALAGTPISFPASPLVSSLYLLPVNVLSLLLVRWALHREGRRLRDLVALEPRRLLRDLAWALLWLAVLYLPFVLAILGTMFALYGGDAFNRFVTVFVPAMDATPALGFTGMLALASLAVATFAPLNAPAEELVYRGYAQGGMRRAGLPAWLAILIPAVAFGVQHIFFAPTPPAMLVFAVAFFVWGAGAGIIYAFQRRLMPLILSHFLVNLITSAPAFAIPFML